MNLQSSECFLFYENVRNGMRALLSSLEWFGTKFWKFWAFTFCETDWIRRNESNFPSVPCSAEYFFSPKMATLQYGCSLDDIPNEDLRMLRINCKRGSFCPHNYGDAIRSIVSILSETFCHKVKCLRIKQLCRWLQLAQLAKGKKSRP